MGISLAIAGFLVAAIVAALVGLNAVALRIFLRERQSIAIPNLAKAAWGLTAMGAFAGPLAPIFSTVGVVCATVALRRYRHDDVVKSVSPLFPLPRSIWGEGGPLLPARMAVVNGIGIFGACVVVVAGVYFTPYFR